MNPERTIVLNGQAFPVVFSQNAIFALTQYLRNNNMGTLASFITRTIPPLDKNGKISPDADLSGLAADGQIFLWACLEGGRRRSHYRHQPFTIDEVGELMQE